LRLSFLIEDGQSWAASPWAWPGRDRKIIQSVPPARAEKPQAPHRVQRLARPRRPRVERWIRRRI